MKRKPNLESLKSLEGAWNIYLAVFILLRILIAWWMGLDEKNRKLWYCGWTDNRFASIKRSNQRNTIERERETQNDPHASQILEDNRISSGDNGGLLNSWTIAAKMTGSPLGVTYNAILQRTPRKA